MFGRLFRLFLLAIFAGVQTSWAAPHLKPGAYPKAARDDVHRPSVKKIRAAGSLHAATLATTIGPKNVAVIMVQFPVGNAALRSGSNSILSPVTINNYFNSMTAYYNEVSFGALPLTFQYFGTSGAANGNGTAAAAGVITLAQPSEYYGCWDEGAGCSGVTTPTSSANGNYLIRDAIVAARTAGGTSLISVENGGTYDAIMVVHAGNGNETTTGTNGDIWSIFYSEDDVISGVSPVSAGAVTAGFTEGVVVPETEANGITSPLGVMAHEFGHVLGLPDLYNTSAIGGDSVVGRWDIMDTGPYLNAGANPAHFGAWCKMAMGWVTPTTITTQADATLLAIESSAALIKLPVQGTTNEYFLVEYRLRNSGALYDQYIPGDGLLVWHVDNDIATDRGLNASTPGDQNTVNSGFPHFGVSIIPQDGISVGSTGGSVNNPFGNDKKLVSPYSFSAQPTGINIVNISGVGSATSAFQVLNLKVMETQNILKLINYPNPAGKGYAHPNGEGHTTFQMQLGRPANEYGFNIYTISGDLVRRIGKNEISLITTIGRTQDYKFLYEYVWDFTNGDGRMVAPGTYLYIGRADGEHANGKAVIIR